MSESDENQKAKIDSLFKGFSNEGYNLSNKLSQTELIKYLDNRSSTGKFDQVLSDKLFQVLILDSENMISVEDFISGYLQFEEDMRKNIDSLNIKLNEKQKIYDELVEKCKKYKEEKLNSEGLCENAKVYGEITEIDIKRKLKGIKEIIIKVIFNDKSEEFHFQMGDINNSQMEHKKFEFKPTSRKDHFEFIMQGLNDKDKLFDIGSKVFPLKDIDTQEEYLVQIIVPEIDDEEKIAAYINAKIILYWSDYKYYEQQRSKAETKLKRLIIAINKANDYLKKVREIYGEFAKRQEAIPDFRQNDEINMNMNNYNDLKEEENREEKNYTVEFNNQKNAQLTVEFNNTKEIKEQNYKEEINNENQVGVNYQNQVGVNYENQEGINYENQAVISYENQQGINNENQVGVNYENQVETNYENQEGINYENQVETNYENQEGINYENQVGTNYENQVGINYENQVGTNYENQVGTNYENQVATNYENQVATNYENQVATNYENQVTTNYENQVGTNYENQVTTNYENQVGTNCENQVGTNCENQVAINYENLKEINQGEIIKENIKEGYGIVETKEKQIEMNNEVYQSVYGNKEGINSYEYLNNYNNNINYESENQIGIEGNIKGLENKEIIEQTSNINTLKEEQLIRQSIKNEFLTQSTLPVIRREKINKVIYDKNIKTLPLIFGGTKVTYLKEGESLDFDISNLGQQNDIKVNEGQEYTKISQGLNYDRFGQKQYGTQVTKIQDFRQELSYSQINQPVNYSQIIQGQNYSQISGGQSYMSLQPKYGQISQSQIIGFEEYKATKY